MKGKQIQIIVGMLILLAIGISGCTEQYNNGSNGNGNGTTTGNTFRMNVKEFLNDTDIQTDFATYMTIDFKSMEEGDTLIFMDTISEIQYLNDVDTTKIVFTMKVGESGYKSFQFFFMGDLTDTYEVDDFVKITVTITHVTLNVEGMDVDMEIFEEAWESEEYYRSHRTTSTGGFYPMPIDTIQKI